MAGLPREALDQLSAGVLVARGRLDSIPSWSHAVHRRTHITNGPIMGTGNQSPAEFEMSDNKKKTGKPDRTRVAANQDYEIGHLAKKHELPRPLVRNVVQQVGPMRSDVEAYLRQMKRNRGG